MKELQAGNVLNKRYEIVQKLGKGGFGEVYKARDTQEAERFVAIKRLLEDEDDVTRKRFEREYRFLSRVAHPNLVHAWEMFEEEKSLYLVLEFVPGNSLGQILKKGEKVFTLAEQLAIANKAARGLEVMNTAGILHRDIKPDNIMVEEATGVVKILDLGIGKDLLSASISLSRNAGPLGTVLYMSPEQVNGEVAETSDVFSMGVTLYQFFLWEKESPFTAENPYQVMAKILEHKPESVYEQEKKRRQFQGQKWDEAEEQAYRQISELVEKAMSKEFEKRCSSKDIADGCEEIQKGLMKPQYEKNQENLRREKSQTIRVENLLLTSMSGQLKPDFSRTLTDFHVEEARDWEVKRARDKSIGRARRFKRHIEEYSKKSQASGTKKKAIWGILALVLLCIPILWTIFGKESAMSGKESLKPGKKAENSSDKGQKKPDIPEQKKPQKLTFGLPEIWNECKYQHEGDWILDMTTKTWCALSAEDQQKYATAYQQEYACQKKLDVKKTITRGGAEFVMRLIPPGRFWMGSNDDDAKELQRVYSDYDETKHRVIIAKPYYIAETEITQAQWKAVMKTTPSHFKGDNLPVERVSWHDCQSFCKKVEMRLPTEAQWEYACRAGVTSAYFWGENWDREKLNSASSWAKQDLMNNEEWQMSDFQHKWQSLGAQTTPVATYRPNSFGLSDMSGNVSEWCQDAYGKEAYHKEDIVDPEYKNGSYRLNRGGSWYGNARDCRCAYRHRKELDNKSSNIGLRVVISEF